MNDTLIMIGISVLQFVAVVMVVYTLFRIRLQPEPPINRQIAMALGLGQRNTVFETPGVRQIMAVALAAARRFPFLRDQLRQNLDASGNPQGYSVEEYLAICLTWAMAAFIIAILTAGLFGPLGVLLIMASPVIGFYMPYWGLQDVARRRAARIGKKLPYTLDLIGLLMESGATFTEAVETVIRDEPDDDLNQELNLVQAEIGFGSTRATALTNMANRIPLESLRGVVGAINQSEQLGTPLSQILKSQAGTLRNLRSVRAEELAAKASLKILVPSLLILFAVVLVVFSPIILAWLNNDRNIL
jgi:tight adherence protein C